MIAGPIGEDGRIEDFTAGATLPRIKGANEIVILFGVHSSFALGTLHNLFLLLCDQVPGRQWQVVSVPITSVVPVFPEWRNKKITKSVVKWISSIFQVFKKSIKRPKKIFPGDQALWTDTFDPLQSCQRAKIAILLTVLLYS
jgi:hypothetical protein